MSMAHSFTLPEDFLWGASTSAHQTEGGNTHSVAWLEARLSARARADDFGTTAAVARLMGSQQILKLAQLGRVEIGLPSKQGHHASTRRGCIR